MYELMEQHPVLTVVGALMLLLRVTLEWIAPLWGSLLGVLAIAPICIWLIVEHVQLRNELRKRGLMLE